MIKNKLQTIAATGLLLVAYACQTKKEEVPVVDKEQIKKEIQEKENEFAATYNAGEIKNIGYYSDDAVSFYQNRKPLVGKDSIAAFLKYNLAFNSNIISFTTKEVFVSNDANQVVEVGYFTLVDSNKAVINQGNYMSLFEKRDGKYVCVRDMSVSETQYP